ncbi:thiopeptide maturation pyridine synthase [Sphaerisporangium corydalis]|uniref:Thiopeptide maturation pyridine synthase n=1 Tax=Sphaerisporangium corydalis TaxID=1441875 RepID=A0ABV9E8W8_9ACTN|nr:thiopeptide maturation pyridine synthase [Sphaerisporangium corydalis]
MEWRSIHVYYYEADKDALILEGVRPLFRRLAGQVGAMSFTRHWRRGPHLRLNVRAGAATFEKVVRPAAEEVIGGFLARRPSVRRRDPEAELPAHRRLAELEGDQGPLTPWHPDNSLRVAPYDRREDVLGNPETADLLADFHAGTTELAFGMIEEVSGPARLALGFNLMIATAHALSGAGITKAFVSFRSHAEGFLCGFPEGAGLRPAWDEHYARNADALVDRVDAVVATLADGRRNVPFVGEWVTTLTPYRGRAGLLVRDGLVPMGDTAPAEGGLAGLSPFHRRLFGDPRWERTRVSADFLRYRLMLNLTYLYLTRLGVAPAERFLLCHLAANAVEDRYDVSASVPTGPSVPTEPAPHAAPREAALREAAPREPAPREAAPREPAPREASSR